MAKIKMQYVCSNCGGIQMKWMGKCPECDEWNTLEEVVVRAAEKSRTAMPTAGSVMSKPLPLAQIPQERMARLPLKIAELNRVLGGGIVPGGCVLVGGDPGIGKSTLLLQMAAEIARTCRPGALCQRRRERPSDRAPRAPVWASKG